MSDLLFTDEETVQRRVDFATAEPEPSFGDQAGEVFQRAGDSVLRGVAMVHEGGTGPVLEGLGRLGQRWEEYGRERDAVQVLPEGFWDGVVETAQYGMESARAHRRELDAPDPVRSTWASETIYGLGTMFTLGALGAVSGGSLGAAAGLTGAGVTAASAAGSAAVLGPTYGVAAFHDLSDEGVDEDTALGAAWIEGGSMALLGALPVSVPGGIITRAASGAAINVPTGMGYRGAMEAYLSSQGYDEQASRYRWDDAQTIFTDAVIGAVFGAAFGGRPEPVHTVPPIHGEGEGAIAEPGPLGEGPSEAQGADYYFEQARQFAQDAEPDFGAAYANALIARELGHPEADGLMEMLAEDGGADAVAQGQAGASIIAIRDGLYEPTIDQIDAALEARNERHARIDTAPGVALDLDAQSRHAESLATAGRQFAEGEDIDVAGAWADYDGEGFAPHPEEQARTVEAEAAVRDVLEQEGFPDLAREVEDLRARIRSMGGELGPDDMMFSARPEAEADFLLALPKDPDQWRAAQALHPSLSNPSRAQAVIMWSARHPDGRFVYSTDEILNRTGYANAQTLYAGIGRLRREGVPVPNRPANPQGAQSPVGGNMTLRMLDIMERAAVQGERVGARALAERLGSTENAIRVRLSRLAKGEGAPEIVERVRKLREQLAQSRARPQNSGVDPAWRGSAMRMRLRRRADAGKASLTVSGASNVEQLTARAEAEFGADWPALSRASFVEISPSIEALSAALRAEGRDAQASWIERARPAAVHFSSANKTFLIANRIHPDDLRGIVLHEIGVHHGMEQMLGPKGWREVLRQVDALGVNDPIVAPIRRDVEALVAAGKMKAADAREETLAYLIETQADLPVVNRVLSRLRQWLVRTFGTTFGMRLTVDDLRAMAAASLRRVAEQARREADVAVDPVPASVPDGRGSGGGQISRNPMGDWESAPLEYTPDASGVMRDQYGRRYYPEPTPQTPQQSMERIAQDSRRIQERMRAKEARRAPPEGFVPERNNSPRGQRVRLSNGSSVVFEVSAPDANHIRTIRWDVAGRPPTNTREILVAVQRAVGRELDAHPRARYDFTAETVSHDALYVRFAREFSHPRFGIRRDGDEWIIDPIANPPNGGPLRDPLFSLGSDGRYKREVLRTSIGEIFINPTTNDMLRLTRRRLGKPEYETDHARYIVDREGNVYAGNGYDMTHDDMALELRRNGVSLPGYAVHMHDGYSHNMRTGSVRRQGDQLRGWPPGDGDMLFSMGGNRGQNRENVLGAKRDPISSPDYQQRIAELRGEDRGDAQKPEAVGSLRGDAPAGRQGSGEGGGASLRTGESGQRGGLGALNKTLAVSGVRIETKPKSGTMGAYRASIDTPVAMGELDAALNAGQGAKGGPTYIDFDLVQAGEGETRAPGVYIRFSRINDAVKGKGAGIWLYRQLIDWAHRQGHAVYSDAVVSAEAQNLYGALSKRGYDVRQINPYARDPEDGGMINTNFDPIFRIEASGMEDAYDAAPPPRDDYQVDGETLRQRQERIDADRQRQAEFDALSPAEQVARTDPNMKFSMGARRLDIGARTRRINLPHPFVGSADVTMNPTKAELAAMLSQQRLRDVQSIRWGIDQDGNLLVWDGLAATHAMVRESADSRFQLHGEIEDALEFDAVLSTAQRAREQGLRGYDPRQVAEELGISVETARRMLQRDGRLNIDAALDALEAEVRAAAEMRKGYEAAARCAIRHGGSMAGRSFLTMGATPAAARTVMAGQAAGLAASVPAGIAATPYLAENARLYAYQEGFRNWLEASRAARAALDTGDAGNFDTPSQDYFPGEEGRSNLGDVLASEADSAAALDAPIPPIPPAGVESRSVTSLGARVPPVPPSLGESDDGAPSAEELIQLLDPLINPDSSQ